jgi:hypothetical protein
MFLGDSIVFWVFGLCYAAAIGATLFLWESIRKQVNRVLPETERFNARSHLPRSMKEFLFATHVYAYYGELWEQHRKYYPGSVLRKSVIFAMASILPSFIGFVVSGIMART